jgi:hypothetical protein
VYCCFKLACDVTDFEAYGLHVQSKASEKIADGKTAKKFISCFFFLDLNSIFSASKQNPKPLLVIFAKCYHENRRRISKNDFLVALLIPECPAELPASYEK